MRCCLKQICTGVNASADERTCEDLTAVGCCVRLSITGTSVSEPVIQQINTRLGPGPMHKLSLLSGHDLRHHGGIMQCKCAK